MKRLGFGNDIAEGWCREIQVAILLLYFTVLSRIALEMASVRGR